MPVARPVQERPATSRAHLAWGHALVVLQGSGAAAASRSSSALTSTPSYNGEWFKKTGLPPTTKAGLGTSEVKNDAFTTDFTSAIGGFVVGRPVLDLPEVRPDPDGALANGVQSALINKATPKEALAAAKSQMESLTS